MNSMFETLMELPLFRGVSRERIAEVVGNAKFHFLKYLPDNTIVETGQTCSHLTFLLAGSARISIANSTGRFRISQTLHGADVIMPQFLFGRNTLYPGNAIALETCNIMQVSKNDYLRILNADPVFMLNYLNLLSSFSQNSVEGVLAVTTGSIEERIAVWIICLTQPGATDIVISCKQRDLYSVFGVQRSSFIASLEGMRERGLIDFSGREITVNDRRAMQDLVQDSVFAEE